MTAAGMTGSTDGRRAAETGAGGMSGETEVLTEGTDIAEPLRGAVDVGMTDPITWLNATSIELSCKRWFQIQCFSLVSLLSLPYSPGSSIKYCHAMLQACSPALHRRGLVY